MGRLLPCVAAVAILTSACAGRRLELPSDPGTALPDYAAIHAEVARACTAVTTLTAEIALSGSAGGERLRGTIHAGFKRPSSMRLELRVSPFGAPAFVLGATAQGATLLFPRNDQVLRDARSDEILAALTGLALSPADLQAILTGCVVAVPTPTGGRTHTGGWIAIDLRDRVTLYLRKVDARWRVMAARRDDLRIDYAQWPETAAFPSRVLLKATTPVAVDLQAGLAQVETNGPIDDDAFSVRVPPTAEPMTLEELRQSGPLRER